MCSHEVLLLGNVSLPETALKSVPDIIKAAADSNLGILALIILVLTSLAILFFRKADDTVRVGIFVLMFAGLGLFGWAMIRANAQANDHSEKVAKTVTTNGASVERLALAGVTV